MNKDELPTHALGVKYDYAVKICDGQKRKEIRSWVPGFMLLKRCGLFVLGGEKQDNNKVIGEFVVDGYMQCNKKQFKQFQAQHKFGDSSDTADELANKWVAFCNPPAAQTFETLKVYLWDLSSVSNYTTPIPFNRSVGSGQRFVKLSDRALSVDPVSNERNVSRTSHRARTVVSSAGRQHVERVPRLGHETRVRREDRARRRLARAVFQADAVFHASRTSTSRRSATRARP